MASTLHNVSSYRQIIIPCWSFVTANTQFDEGANKIDTITGTTLDENKKQQGIR